MMVSDGTEIGSLLRSLWMAAILLNVRGGVFAIRALLVEMRVPLL